MGQGYQVLTLGSGYPPVSFFARYMHVSVARIPFVIAYNIASHALKTLY